MTTLDPRRRSCCPDRYRLRGVERELTMRDRAFWGERDYAVSALRRERYPL